ncbi:uncharacterized protein LOC132562136 [Ylistrum balloti]|uniref:uncharacterized protein LOC132562136 n=1 Tax=Ylistrum balloti TaxID=509963 RepID=UPI002905DE7F|nr:uncharacterized protein LOC132562136 [Ylistrum balloti]
MSRIKIRTLYLVVIAISIFILLFFINPLNLTSYSTLHKQNLLLNIQESSRLHHLFAKDTEDVGKNETDKMTSPENVTKKSKIEIDMDLLERIESLLTDIRSKKRDNRLEVSNGLKRRKDQDHTATNERKDIPKVTGQRSKDTDPKVIESKSMDGKFGFLLSKFRRNEISNVTDEKQLIEQKNAKELDKDSLGNIQGVTKYENGHQLSQQLNTIRYSPETPSKSDNENKADVCDSCFKNDFKYLINPESMCKHSGDLDLLIVVSSAPSDRNARDSLRKTWASTSMMKSMNMKCVFFVGIIDNHQTQRSLKEESEQYHDIVQLQFKDSYSNLTYKTLSELRWVSEFCANTKYVMKTDSDMFVNTYILPNILKGISNARFIGGHCWGPSPPHREANSKWYVSYKSYRHSSFPPMCSGTGYIISLDLVLEILQISKNIPYFHLEDVFIALCIKKLNVKPVYLQGFSNMRTPYDACRYRYKVVTSHEIAPNLLVNYWENMLKCSMKLEEQQYQPKDLYLP